MEKDLVDYILESLKIDYLVGNCYREDSVKACLYFSIRNYFLEENNLIEELENKIFVYPEIRNLLYVENTEKIYRERFDLVITKGYLENYSSDDIQTNDNDDYTKIKGYKGLTDIIEIKYIKGNKKQIVKSLESDFIKLLKLDISKTEKISKNIFFIYEHYKRNNKYLENVKNEILKIGESEENIKNSKIKINIFGLFVDLHNDYKIGFFESLKN